MNNYKDYERPSVAADIVTFGIDSERAVNKRELDSKMLKILLIKRGEEPFKGQYSLPGGFLRPTETIEEAALRELKEETGAECKELIYLGKTFPSPALLGEVIHIFFARGLVFGEATPDEDEFIECERIPLEKLVEMTCNGEVLDAKTQIAALRVWKMIRE